MGEDKEIPTNENRSPEELAREYREAYNKLKSYVDDKGNRSIDNYDRLAYITYPLGGSFETAIKSKGKQSEEKENHKGIYYEGKRNWLNPLTGVQERKKVGVSAVHEPEENSIHISGSSEEQGHQIFIPVDTSPLGMFVKKRQPIIIIWEGHERTMTYNPSSERYKKSPDYLVMYSQCLYESVSAILDILPEPISD